MYNDMNGFEPDPFGMGIDGGMDHMGGMGYDPYIMIYDKPNAPQEVRYLQRWCNNKRIFKKTEKFEDYDPRRG